MFFRETSVVAIHEDENGLDESIQNIRLFLGQTGHYNEFSYPPRKNFGFDVVSFVKDLTSNPTVASKKLF